MGLGRVYKGEKIRIIPFHEHSYIWSTCERKFCDLLERTHHWKVMTARDVINLHQGLTKSEIDCIINQSREGKNLRSNIVLASEEEMEVSDHSIADSILADYKSEGKSKLFYQDL